MSNHVISIQFTGETKEYQVSLQDKGNITVFTEKNHANIEEIVDIRDPDCLLKGIENDVHREVDHYLRYKDTVQRTFAEIIEKYAPSDGEETINSQLQARNCGDTMHQLADMLKEEVTEVFFFSFLPEYENGDPRLAQEERDKKVLNNWIRNHEPFRKDNTDRIIIYAQAFATDCAARNQNPKEYTEKQLADHDPTDYNELTLVLFQSNDCSLLEATDINFAELFHKLELNNPF